MEVNDLRRLHMMLNDVMHEEPSLLRRANIPRILRLRELSLQGIQSTTCEAILVTQLSEERRRSSEWFRSWLVPFHNTRLWLCYRLRTELTQDACTALLERLASAVQIGDRVTEISRAETGSEIYASLLTGDSEGMPSDESVVRVALWHGQPFVAFHCSGRTLRRQVRVALQGEVSGDALPLQGVSHTAFNTDAREAVRYVVTWRNRQRQEPFEAAGGFVADEGAESS